MQLRYCLLALSSLTVLAAGQDSSIDTTLSPINRDKGSKGGGRCKNVTCDRTVLEECEQPIVFAGDGCCPVCPMTDVCDGVECGENETCSERGGQAVCCTVLKKSVQKPRIRSFFRRAYGKRNCSRQADRKPGVKRGPCASAVCQEGEICIGVRKTAFCCEKLPPCDDKLPPFTVLGACHLPGAEAPETPTRKPGRGRSKKRRCRCRPSLPPRPSRLPWRPWPRPSIRPRPTRRPIPYGTSGRRVRGRVGRKTKDRDGEKGKGRGGPRRRCKCGRRAAKRLRQSLRKLSRLLRQCRKADAQELE